MPGYGVANPGSLIGFVFLFIAFQLQHGQCALPNSLLLFVQARGVFLGACNFIATCFNTTANAPFGSCLHSVNATCHSRQKRLQRRRTGAWAAAPRPRPRRLGALGRGSGLGWELLCCCCSAFAWLIALLACLLRSLGWLRWSPFLFGFCG